MKFKTLARKLASEHEALAFVTGSGPYDAWSYNKRGKRLWIAWDMSKAALERRLDAQGYTRLTPKTNYISGGTN